ncbi:MAG: MBL fold metallo-hydrolase [Lachnospiraceae bacterium]|nr:MBL fold metallo-hydrolase [Lachnospiraceae bacterium]
MIDCGCSGENIREYAGRLLEKAVDTVICTHSHIDHTGNAGFFPHVCMTERTAIGAKNPMDEDPGRLRLDYIPQIIAPGPLQVGDLTLEIILCDCHCPGNIMILDRKDGILFTGDEIDRDQVLLLPGFSERRGQYHSSPAATVGEYRSMLMGLQVFQPVVTNLCTGHNGSPLPFSVIDEMISLCDDVLSGKEASRDCRSDTYSPDMTHFPFYEANYCRYSRNGCSLVYCMDDLHDRRNNSIHIPATPLHGICEENKQKGY